MPKGRLIGIALVLLAWPLFTVPKGLDLYFYFILDSGSAQWAS